MQPTNAKILFGSLWPTAPEGLKISSVATDSRNAQANGVFVAIKGEHVDGHDYAATALQNGAAVVVATHPVDGVPLDKTVLVKDPLNAMIELGGNYRGQFHPLVLGVTGSVGKTTTKEFCAAVLQPFGATVKTEGNQNNEIGMPNTLFRLDENTRYAVVEMGTQMLGDIRKLSLAAKPDAAVITRIGTAHLETLGSVENVLHAKLEICDGLATGAPLILNGDDPMLWKAVLPAHVRPVYAGIQNAECEIRATDICREGMGQSFTIADKRYGNFSVYIEALGEHNIYNALMAYTAATRLGLSAPTAAEALKNFKNTGMRQNIVKKQDVTVIEDCYNASPDSMRAALSTLRDMDVPGKRIAVLGDMLELGSVSEDAHKELADLCANAGVDLLLTVGQRAAAAVPRAQGFGINALAQQNNTEAARQLLKNVQPGDAILVKASRGMKFEEIIETFFAQYGK